MHILQSMRLAVSLIYHCKKFYSFIVQAPEDADSLLKITIIYVHAHLRMTRKIYNFEWSNHTGRIFKVIENLITLTKLLPDESNSFF
jgi:hypothetical protein